MSIASLATDSERALTTAHAVGIGGEQTALNDYTLQLQNSFKKMWQAIIFIGVFPFGSI